MKKLKSIFSKYKSLTIIFFIFFLGWPLLSIFKKLISKASLSADNALTSVTAGLPISDINKYRSQADIIKSEVEAFNTNEARIISILNEIPTLAELELFNKVYFAINNTTLQNDLSTCFSTTDYFDLKKLKVSFRIYLKI
jgi:hypothetical protein